MRLLLLLTLLATGCCLSAPETSAHILSASESADDRLAAIQYWRRDLEILPALATLPQTGRLQENPTGALNELRLAQQDHWCIPSLVTLEPDGCTIPRRVVRRSKMCSTSYSRGLVRPHRAKVNLLLAKVVFFWRK